MILVYIAAAIVWLVILGVVLAGAIIFYGVHQGWDIPVKRSKLNENPPYPFPPQRHRDVAEIDGGDNFGG